MGWLRASVDRGLRNLHRLGFTPCPYRCPEPDQTLLAQIPQCFWATRTCCRHRYSSGNALLGLRAGSAGTGRCASLSRVQSTDASKRDAAGTSLSPCIQTRRRSGPIWGLARESWSACGVTCFSHTCVHGLVGLWPWTRSWRDGCAPNRVPPESCDSVGIAAIRPDWLPPADSRMIRVGARRRWSAFGASIIQGEFDHVQCVSSALPGWT